jgi:hypothetical protein
VTHTVDPGHHHLLQRIERFVAALERYGRNPNRREAYHSLVAIECLRAGRYEDGERAIQSAKHVEAIPTQMATLPGLYDHLTTQELRTALGCRT